jgi:hypothetical protein
MTVVPDSPWSYQPQSSTAEALALTDLWRQRYPDSRPIGDELKYSVNSRWIRFHSLPQSKRYADTEAEYAEILLRHTTLLRELVEPSDGEGKLRDLLVVTESWSQSPLLVPRDERVVAVSPDGWPWISIQVEDDDEIWTHLFVDHVELLDPRLAALLRLVADDEVEGVIVADQQLTWLYHPYDGGADVIAPTTEDRDKLKAQHPKWLSKHGAGL